MLADLGLWDKLSTWCLWNHQELHAEVLALRMTGARPSSALQCVIATVPKVLFDPAAPTMPPFLIFGIHLGYLSPFWPDRANVLGIWRFNPFARGQDGQCL